MPAIPIRGKLSKNTEAEGRQGSKEEKGRRRKEEGRKEAAAAAAAAHSFLTKIWAALAFSLCKLYLNF